MAGCLNANTENDIPCQQCTSDTSLSLQIPLFCSGALFSTLVSRQRERFPLLVSIKRVNSLHLSTYHLRARRDARMICQCFLTRCGRRWSPSLETEREPSYLTWYLPAETPHPQPESVRPVTSSSPHQRLLLSQGEAKTQRTVHTGSHLLTKWKIWWTCNQKFVDAYRWISYRWISQTCQRVTLKL